MWSSEYSFILVKCRGLLVSTHTFLTHVRLEVDEGQYR